MPNTPQSAAEVLTALAEHFDQFPPALQVAARLLVDHPRDVSLYSMRKLAARANVHPNAFVRLARELGFSGYEELRERFRDFRVGDEFASFGARSDWLHDLQAEGGAATLVAQLFEATSDNLQRGLAKQDINQLSMVCEWVQNSNSVYVLGTGAAHCLAQQFWYVARMAFDHIKLLPGPASHPLDDLHAIDEADMLLALTFQPYRSDTMAAVRFARERGVSIVGVTDSASSPLAREADIPLVCPTHTPHFFSSNAAVTALLECLIAILVAQAPSAVRDRIDEFHQRRMDIGLYEEEQLLAGATA